MKISLILLIILCTATENEGVETRPLFAATGSSVSFCVKIDEFTLFDLRRPDGSLALTCHEDCRVRDPYTQRGQVYGHNETFVLRDLRAEDSGIYESITNNTVKARIHLHVIAPVKDPVLLKQEVRVNGSQCQIDLICRTEGDGPLNFTFLRNGHEILHNENTTDNSSSLSLGGWDPQTSGRFSCNVTNPVSSETSPSIVLLPPVQPYQLMMALFVIDLLILWGIAMLNEIALRQCHKKCQQQRSANQVTSRYLSLLIQVFTLVDHGAGFIKEGGAAAISFYGGFLPVWCCVFPPFFLLCRTTYWMIVLANYRKKYVTFPIIKDFCDRAMWLSNIFGVPIFCAAFLWIYHTYYDRSCAMMHMWHFLLIVPIVSIVFAICYTWIKNKLMDKVMQQSQGTDDQHEKVQTELISHVANGNLLPPENNEDPYCEGHEPGGVVHIPNGNQETPVQEVSCENMTEGGPEESSISEPEGQAQGTKKITCKNPMRAAPNYGDSDGTKGGEGQPLLTTETDVEKLEDRVANG